MSEDKRQDGKKKHSSLTALATGMMFITFVLCCCMYGYIVIPQLAEKNVRATMLPDVATRPVEETQVEAPAPEEVVKGVKNLSVDVINPGMEDGSKGGSSNTMPLYTGETVCFTKLDEENSFYVFIQDTDSYRYPSEYAEYTGELEAGWIIQVVAISDNGWAAVYDDGVKYVVAKNLVPTIRPEDWNDEELYLPEDIVSSSAGEDGALVGCKFFSPVPGGKFYLIDETTQLRNLPSAETSGSYAADSGTMVNVLAFSDDGWAQLEFASNIYYLKADLLSEVMPEEQSGTGDESAPDGGSGSGGSGSSGSSSSSSSDASTTPAPQAPSADVANNTAPNTEAGSLLAMVNDLRAENGLAPLSWSDDLASCANVRAAELPYASDDQNMAHIRPDGSEWWTVNSSIMYGENIACGQQSASEVFQAWVNSPSHKANMLNPDYKTMGAAYCVSGDGAYGTYWAQEFGV